MDWKKISNALPFLLFVTIILVFMGFLFVFITENSGFLHEVANRFGLLGLFGGAIIANATIFLPIPFDAVMFFVGAQPQLVGLEGFTFFGFFLAAVLAGFGAAIGEMTAYIAGLTGVKTLEELKNKEFERLSKIRHHLRSYGMWFVFFASIIPFPFDLIGITAGVIKYDFRRFFLAAGCGKILRYLLVLLAGHFGFQFVMSFFSIG